MTDATPSSDLPSRQTFVNLPVKDLKATTEFFTKLGFSFDPQATDETTTRMLLSENSSVMLHTEQFFEQFTGSRTADTSTSREVVVGLSADSREQVDDMAAMAVDAGGEAVGDAVDQGFMYMRAIRDLDGHQWSFLFMDVSPPTA